MKKFKVLIVEDEAIIALHMKNVVLRLGNYDCTSVASGEHAVEISKALNPDLIFMDINLKGKINGIEAARQICTGIDVPIVFVSAYSDDDTIQQARRINPAGYLTKPIYANAVHKTIESILESKCEEQFSVNYEVQDVGTSEYGGILETPIMALPQFILHPEE